MSRTQTPSLALRVGIEQNRRQGHTMGLNFFRRRPHALDLSLRVVPGRAVDGRGPAERGAAAAAQDRQHGSALRPADGEGRGRRNHRAAASSGPRGSPGRKRPRTSSAAAGCCVCAAAGSSPNRASSSFPTFRTTSCTSGRTANFPSSSSPRATRARRRAAASRAMSLAADGLLFDSQGRLTLCEHGDRRVSRIEHNGTKTVLADNYEGIACRLRCSRFPRRHRPSCNRLQCSQPRRMLRRRPTATT